jgi:hypothetical protein
MNPSSSANTGSSNLSSGFRTGSNTTQNNNQSYQWGSNTSNTINTAKTGNTGFGIISTQPITTQPTFNTNTSNTNAGYNNFQMAQLLQQMTLTLQAMNPNPTGNVAQVSQAELNLVKPTYFYGTDNEDPYEWLASFERAASANQWTNNRKIAIAAGYLRDAAAKWYNENQPTFQN